MGERTGNDRKAGLAVLAIGTVTFLAVVVACVPWHPVPGGSPPAVPAASVFSQAQVERATAYADGARLIGWSSLAVSLLIMGGLGFTRLGGRILERFRLPWPIAVVGLGALVLLLEEVAMLPFTILAWHRRRDVGLTHQDLSGLLRDEVVGFVIQVVVTTVAALALVGLARLLPRWWPVVAGLTGSAFVVVATYLYPLVIEPAFNTFTPLADGALHQKIDALARHEGVPLDEVLVADASRRTTSANAYVSGFGGSRRVVLYDTLLEDFSQREVLSVVGHELAHARHDDVMTGTLLGAAGALIGIGLVSVIVGNPRVRRRVRIDGASDPRVVPLVLALVAFGSVLAAPVENGVSRQMETRADVDALKATGDPVAFEGMQRKLALGAVADPEPPAWSQWWFGSHPTVLQRIAIARAGR